MDAIALLGHAFVELSYACREVTKPNMYREFMGLCSEKMPVTTNLFGDKMESECKSIKTSHKLSQVASHSRNREYLDKCNTTFGPRQENSMKHFLSKKKPWQNQRSWYPKSSH